MIKSYFIKNIIIRTLSKILQKNIFIFAKILNFNDRNKNFQTLRLGQKNLKIFNGTLVLGKMIKLLNGKTAKFFGKSSLFIKNNYITLKLLE